MASASTAASLFISFNLLFFALVSSTYVHPSNYGNVNENRNQKGIMNVNDLSNGDYTNLNKAQQDKCNLNLGLCLGLLGGLVKAEVGNVNGDYTHPCCSLIAGLVDLEASVCLCTAIKLNVLDIIKLNLPINLSILLNNCGRNPALEYRCA